jgi:hypothetical protein
MFQGASGNSSAAMKGIPSAGGLSGEGTCVVRTVAYGTFREHVTNKLRMDYPPKDMWDSFQMSELRDQDVVPRERSRILDRESGELAVMLRDSDGDNHYVQRNEGGGVSGEKGDSAKGDAAGGSSSSSTAGGSTGSGSRTKTPGGVGQASSKSVNDEQELPSSSKMEPVFNRTYLTLREWDPFGWQVMETFSKLLYSRYNDIEDAWYDLDQGDQNYVSFTEFDLFCDELGFSMGESRNKAKGGKKGGNPNIILGDKSESKF